MIEIKGIQFSVNIERKRIKNLYLKVNGTTIEASVPFYVLDYEVYKFINTKRDWVYNAYLHSQYKMKTTLKYMGGDSFYIFNEKYNLITNKANRSSCKIVDKNIYLNYSNEETKIDYLYKYLDSKLLLEAKKLLDKYMYMLIDYGYKYTPELSARKMTSRWGVCYTKKNKINVSSYLIHYPLDCLEYIIVHEITHFIVPNHSKRFYEIIERNMPNYKKANEKLKY